MNKSAWGIVLGLAMAATGCFPSRAARSSGSVGCAPDQIEISNEQQQIGLIQSGETWEATCQGRTFYCTQLDHVSRDHEPFGAFLASDHVSCTEEPESPQEESNREARQMARAMAAVPKPQLSAPKGAAGFEFGLSAEQAQQRCEAAGQTWDATIPELSTCSGPAAPNGLAASVGLVFCDARACGIQLEARPKRDFSSEVVSLKSKLEQKYGPAEAETRGIPAKCRSDAAFKQCLTTRELSLRYSWRWGSGESLELLVGRSPTEETPAIKIVYARKGSGTDSSAL